MRHNERITVQMKKGNMYVGSWYTLYTLLYPTYIPCPVIHSMLNSHRPEAHAHS